MAIHEVAAALREGIAERVHALCPAGDNDGLPMFVSDTMAAALERVDWDAIATAWLETYAEVPA
mgnify:CR=1 FL=1